MSTYVAVVLPQWLLWLLLIYMLLSMALDFLKHCLQRRIRKLEEENKRLYQRVSDTLARAALAKARGERG